PLSLARPRILEVQRVLPLARLDRATRRQLPERQARVHLEIHLPARPAEPPDLERHLVTLGDRRRTELRRLDRTILLGVELEVTREGRPPVPRVLPENEDRALLPVRPDGRDPPGPERVPRRGHGRRERRLPQRLPVPHVDHAPVRVPPPSEDPRRVQEI